VRFSHGRFYAKLFISPKNAWRHCNLYVFRVSWNCVTSLLWWIWSLKNTDGGSRVVQAPCYLLISVKTLLAKILVTSRKIHHFLADKVFTDKMVSLPVSKAANMNDEQTLLRSWAKPDVYALHKNFFTFLRQVGLPVHITSGFLTTVSKRLVVAQDQAIWLPHVLQQ